MYIAGSYLEFEIEEPLTELYLSVSLFLTVINSNDNLVQARNAQMNVLVSISRNHKKFSFGYTQDTDMHGELIFDHRKCIYLIENLSAFMTEKYFFEEFKEDSNDDELLLGLKNYVIYLSESLTKNLIKNSLNLNSI